MSIASWQREPRHRRIRANPNRKYSDAIWAEALRVLRRRGQIDEERLAEAITYARERLDRGVVA